MHIEDLELDWAELLLEFRFPRRWEEPRSELEFIRIFGSVRLPRPGKAGRARR